MTKTYTFAESITRTRIEAALRQGARDAAAVALVACTVRTHAAKILKHLHAEKLIHVARWKQGARGPKVPVYRWGPGKDAPKAPPLSAAAKCKRYRSAQRAHYGDNYKLVHAAQKQHIPGRQVVVDGAVVYQQ